jgi:glucose/mannose transport system substrate-binding protein
MNRTSRWAGLACCVCGSVACGAQPVTEADLVEIDTVPYTTAEGDAFRAAIGPFETSHPAAEVAVVYGRADRLDFDQAMAAGRPPDLFQTRAGYDMLRWAALLAPLDDVAASQSVAARMPSGVLEALTAGGHVYGVPFTVERDNTLYYNQAVFSENGLAPPRTLAEFFTVAEVLEAKGIIPLAIGSARPWAIGMVAWPWLLVEHAGPAYYAEFFEGKRDPADLEIAATLANLAQVLAVSNYRVRSTDVAAALAADSAAPDPQDPTTMSWPGAVDLMISGKAAMTIAGDFAKAHLVEGGHVPDADFGETPAPGTAGSFVFYATAFGLPGAAPHPALGADLAAILASAPAQATFNAASATIPACTDADRTAFDEMDRRRMDDLATATAVVKVFDTFASREAIDALDDPLRTFAEDGDVAKAVAALGQRYAAIKTQ